MPRLIPLCAAICFCLFIGRTYAGEARGTNNAGTTAAAFEAGAWELQSGVGLFVSENYFDPLRPQINDVDATVRLGYMLNSPAPMPLLRANFEILAEIFGGGVIKGPADVIAGTTLFLRYNVVYPGAWLIPYVQVGAGGAYSDAYQDPIQRELGGPLSFNLQAGFGARVLVSPTSAVFVEFDYRHLSNAGIADRNRGLNSGGAWLGASFFF